MTRDRGPFSLANPWPRAGWGTLAVILGISLVLGFIVLSRYQQNGEPLGAWAAICRGLGLAPDVGPASAPQRPLRTATLVAWTGGTLDQIAAGNAKDGAFIALNCTACHGEGGVSTSDLIPTLAGMDPAFRSLRSVFTVRVSAQPVRIVPNYRALRQDLAVHRLQRR